jgi:fatty-acyl-CoA synthase
MKYGDYLFVQKKEREMELHEKYLKKDEKGLCINTIGELLDINAELWPDRDAAVFCEQNKRYTWKQLKKICDTAAKNFLHLGIKKGDKIAIWATNTPEWLITYFAAEKIGAAIVTMNPEWKKDEVEYALKQSDTHTLIMIEGFSKQTGKGIEKYDYLGIIQEIYPELTSSIEGELKCAKLPKLRNIILISDYWKVGTFRWKNVMDMDFSYTDKLLKTKQKLVTHKDIAILQLTSGTTGNPKCAMLTHLNVISNAIFSAENMKLTYEDILLSPVAPDHIFGTVLSVLCCLVTGATIVIPNSTFDARKTLEAAQKEKCTAINGVPRMFALELEVSDFEKFDLSRLRTGLIAGSRCTPKLMRQIFKKIAPEVRIVYGQSEASPTITQVKYDDTRDLETSTVGKPIFGTEVKIVDPETGIELPIEKVGELWARGPQVMKGYYNDTEKTAEKITKDGWLKTGDFLKELPNGYFEFVDRASSLIVVNGQNVYPAAIETCLLENPMISDTIVVGVPSKKSGGDQEVCSCILLKQGCSLTIDEVKNWVKERKLYHNIPTYVEFVDNLPMTASGKLSASKMKTIMLEKLGLQ